MNRQCRNHTMPLAGYIEVNLGVVLTYQCLNCHYRTSAITGKEVLEEIADALVSELIPHLV